MNTAELVVKLSNPYFGFDSKSPSEKTVQKAMDYAARKKVYPLFYVGCQKNNFSMPKEAEALMAKYLRRREKQIEATKLLCNIKEKHGIEFLVFKTFRPFNYIPDDVDILLRREEDLASLVSLLKEKDYFVHNIGTPEVGLRKVENGTYVDLDVHKKLAIGQLDVFNVEWLWQNHAFTLLDIGDGYKVAKLSEDYEVVREAAYSLLKDFNISIAGLYLGLNALLHEDLVEIEKVADEQNFALHLHVYLNLVNELAFVYFPREANRLKYKPRELPFFLLKGKQQRVPYPYPFSTIIWAYLNRTLNEVNRQRNTKVISQIIKQPTSKGINVIFDYLREIST